jgi:hypothetical protein
MNITIKRLENAGFKQQPPPFENDYVKDIDSSTDIYVETSSRKIAVSTVVEKYCSYAYILEYNEKALVKLWSLYSTEELDFEDKVYTGAEKYWYEGYCDNYPSTDITNKDEKQFSFEDIIEIANDYGNYILEEYKKSQPAPEVNKSNESISDALKELQEAKKNYPPYNSDGLPPFKQIYTEQCLHKSCTICNGTGRKLIDGSICVHMISCPCNKCTPTY